MRWACLVALLVLLGNACSPSRAAHTQVTPGPAVHSFAGGCAGTAVTDAEPPAWARGGWSNYTDGEPWSVPWAMGTPANGVAFLFAVQLVAGASPRSDGTNNKILWVAKNAATGFLVAGRPLGQPKPVVTAVGGPSIIDVPTSGCWTFRLTGTPGGSPISTINLEALPNGALPSRAPIPS